MKQKNQPKLSLFDNTPTKWQITGQRIRNYCDNANSNIKHKSIKQISIKQFLT